MICDFVNYFSRQGKNSEFQEWSLAEDDLWHSVRCKRDRFMSVSAWDKAAYGFLIYALESNFFPFPLHHLKVVLKYQLTWSSRIPLLSEVGHILSGGN